MLRNWSNARMKDFASQSYILQYTKPCPNCKINIEKNGGCMHMTCRKCSHQFCWICKKTWAASHNCFVEDNDKGHGDIYADARRFSSYNDMHETMKQAYDLDANNYKRKMSSVVELELENQWIKVEFVAQAVEVLLQCRRTLMYSYIFSYFMATIDNQMYIFEENLKYLVQRTEELSEILEHEITAENVEKLKETIRDKTNLCTIRRRSLIDHIQEGYDKNWWRAFPIPPEELLSTGQV